MSDNSLNERARGLVLLSLLIARDDDKNRERKNNKMPPTNITFLIHKFSMKVQLHMCASDPLSEGKTCFSYT